MKTLSMPRPSIDATLIALVHWSALRTLGHPSKIGLILAGLATGVCILTRPTITLYLRIYRIVYALALGLGLLGLYWGWSRYPQARWGILLSLLLFGVVSLSQSLFYVNIRHRWGIESLWLIFTGVGAAELWQDVRRWWEKDAWTNPRRPS